MVIKDGDKHAHIHTHIYNDTMFLWLSCNLTDFKHLKYSSLSKNVRQPNLEQV